MVSKRRTEHANPDKLATIPRDFPKAAGEIYYAIEKELKAIGGIKYLDEEFILGYCYNAAKCVQLRKDLEAEGTTLTDPKSGRPYTNPKFALLKTSSELVMKYGDRLGIGAAVRTRLNISSAPKSEEESLV